MDMRTKTVHLLVAMAAVACSPHWHAYPQQPTSAPECEEIAVIQLFRESGQLAHFPTYSITLRSNGTVLYDGVAGNDPVEMREGAVSRDQFVELRRSLESLLPDKQPPPRMCGWFMAAPTTLIRLSFGDEHRSVMISDRVGVLGSEADPAAIHRLAEGIDDACATAQWADQ